MGMERQVAWDISPALKQKMTEVARLFRKLDGRRFRRQQPIGVFVVDFYCSAEKLIVEVDGAIHELQREHDQQRQELLESLGLKMVRVTSKQVETDIDSALALIRQFYTASDPPLPPWERG
jgi:very-short-patch-repair endonuclease